MSEPIIDHAFKAMEVTRDYEELIEATIDPATGKPFTGVSGTIDFNRTSFLMAKISMHSQLAVRDAIKEQTTAMREQSELMAAALADNMSPEQAKNFLKVVTGQVESGSKK